MNPHHPCLNCTLPDCDDQRKDCGLKLAINLQSRRKLAGVPMTEAERLAYNAAFNEKYGASRKARRLEMKSA